MELSDWFKGFEKGIAKLAAEQREQFFSECGKHCVQCGTLQVYKELYEKANGGMDDFFSKIRYANRNKLEISHLRAFFKERGNDLATVAISAICNVILPYNSV